MFIADALAIPRRRSEATSDRPSPEEQVPEPLPRRLPPDLGDRVGQRNLLRTHLDAVLGVAAVGDAAGAHEDVQALVLVHRAGRMEVHQERLADARRPAEAAAAVDLRADFEAERARDAAIERVAELLEIGSDARPRPEVVGAID